MEMSENERCDRDSYRLSLVVLFCCFMVCSTIATCYITSWLPQIIDHIRVPVDQLSHIR